MSNTIPKLLPKRYYVYMYLRDDGSPYYIGKGKEKRAWKNNRNIPRPKNFDNIVIVIDNISETVALEIEKRFIKWFGRVDIGTGILRNLTDGGDGAWNVNPETLKNKGPKISKSKKGKKFSKHHRQALSDSHKGYKIPKHHLFKRIIAQTGKNHNTHKGWFHTPKGKFPTTTNPYFPRNTLQRYCKNPNKIIGVNSYSKSEYLQSLGTKEEISVLTYKDIGFWYEYN